MLKIITWDTASPAEQKQLLTRAPKGASVKKTIESVVAAVQKHGDAALFELTEKFDGVKLDSLAVSPSELLAAQVSEETRQALTVAIQTITTYHKALTPSSLKIHTANGVVIERVYRSIQSVGLYVPNGLVSSLLMQAIPAGIAGCPVRVLCTPPSSNGAIDETLLVAARLCGVDSIYKIGGAQAIAAMAYGTQTVPKVDKIFGPGNQYVEQAKTFVSNDPRGAAIDIPAGPSEVMILADSFANPVFIAADLLAQAEHGPDSQVICICENKAFADAVIDALSTQLNQLARKEIILRALPFGSVIICSDKAQQLAIINNYAPEHLIINRVDAADYANNIICAGTIFVGPWAAETMGDYATGSNHVLPTNGYARNHSGLSTADFLKAISIQSITEVGIQSLGPVAQTLANLEGLDAHANAITLRLQALEELK